MTDLEKLKSCFDDLGIKYEEIVEDYHLRTCKGKIKELEYDKVIIITCGLFDNCFYFKFNKFIKHYIWE